jgi:hypothetical protein
MFDEDARTVWHSCTNGHKDLRRKKPFAVGSTPQNGAGRLPALEEAQGLPETLGGLVDLILDQLEERHGESAPVSPCTAPPLLDSSSHPRILPPLFETCRSPALLSCRTPAAQARSWCGQR